jgi:hypothetical protein
MRGHFTTGAASASKSVDDRLKAGAAENLAVRADVVYDVSL